jgi:phenylalanyl-tRNA synthetase beta chain
MKISYKWLKELLPINHTPEEISQMLTDCGLEVESFEEVESIRGGLKGVVIGHVLTVEKHPDADKLNLTTVDVGTGTILNIVCGAPNVAAGQKVLVATIGAKLYPSEGEPFDIKKSKIRGAVSEGMICAEDEIGLGASHAGIMVLPEDAPIGKDAAAYFNIDNDVVFEIGLTPNRIDAASHIGVARDLAAVINAKNINNDLEVQLPHNDLSTLQEGEHSPVQVNIQHPESCVRYSGISISNIKVAESPAWLKNRLLAIGLRPINNIVDVTNYVMHECAQPLHAFDISKIEGAQINVRFAHENEKLITLDEATRELQTTDVVIADASKAMCIAGVFGGKDSGVSESTTSIFIESACFNPVLVRKTSKRLNLKTDSSFRFERGTDPNNTLYALERAAQLICELAGGKIASEITDHYPEKVNPKVIAFSYENSDRLIGKAIEHKIVNVILKSLGIEILEKGSDALKIAIPTAKVDVTREADVIEEVLRIYGYNNIELTNKLNASVSYTAKPDYEKWQQQVSALLASVGYSEIMGMSLTSSKHAIETDTLAPVKILNPLSSELSILRQTLLNTGLETIAYNQNRKRSNLRLFEFGKCYQYDATAEGLKKYSEKYILSMFVTGAKHEDSWAMKNSEVNLFSLKSAVELVFKRTGIKTSVSEITDTNGYGISYLLNEKPMAKVLHINKSTLKNADVKGEVFYAEIDWNLLVKAANKSKTEFSELPKYPEAKRDLALLVNKQVKYAELEKLAFKTERKLLKSVNLFDVYEGKNLPEGKKSYALSFVLRDEQATLNDKQIEGIMSKLQQNFEKEFEATLRS